MASPELGLLFPMPGCVGHSPPWGRAHPLRPGSPPPALHTSSCPWSSTPVPTLPAQGQCRAWGGLSHRTGGTGNSCWDVASGAQGKSPLKANRAQASTELCGMAGEGTQQLPASFPRPGNGARSKAPGSDAPHPQLWTLRLSQRGCNPWQGAIPKPWFGAGGPPRPLVPEGTRCTPGVLSQAEPQTCTTCPKTVLSTGQLRLPRAGSSPVSWGMSPTAVWHRPLFM